MMPEKNNRKKHSRNALFLVAIIAGMGITLAFPQQTGDAYYEQALAVIQGLLASQQEHTSVNKQLIERIDQLEMSISQLEQQATQGDEQAQMLLEQTQQARQFVGLTEMIGPGLEITIDDARIEYGTTNNYDLYLIHDLDLLTILNALNSAGAEAIAINGVRYINNTRVFCGGPAIHVRGVPLTPPYVITAIGDSQRMIQLLMEPSPGRNESIYEEITFFGQVFEIREKQEIVIPRFYDEINYRYMQAR